MQVKRYEVANIREASAKIKNDLGPDAVILSTKRIQGGKGTRIEVVAGKDDGRKSSPESQRSVGQHEPQNQDLEQGIGGMMREISAMTAMLREMREEESPRGEWREFKGMLETLFDMFGLKKDASSHHPLSQVYRHLTAHGMSRDRASKLVTALRQGGAKEISSCEAGLARIEQCISQRLAPLAQECTGKRVKAFLGPTGVGKTTTIAKLASLYALEKKVDVGLITMDTFRIAAVEQLKTYARIIGVPLEVAADKSLGDELDPYLPMLHRAESRIDGLVQLIGDLLALSRSEQQAQAEPVLLEVQAAVESVLGLQAGPLLAVDQRGRAGQIEAERGEHVLRLPAQFAQDLRGRGLLLTQLRQEFLKSHAGVSFWRGRARASASGRVQLAERHDGRRHAGAIERGPVDGERRIIDDMRLAAHARQGRPAEDAHLADRLRLHPALQVGGRGVHHPAEVGLAVAPQRADPMGHRIGKLGVDVLRPLMAEEAGEAVRHDLADDLLQCLRAVVPAARALAGRHLHDDLQRLGVPGLERRQVHPGRERYILHLELAGDDGREAHQLAAGAAGVSQIAHLPGRFCEPGSDDDAPCAGKKKTAGASPVSEKPAAEEPRCYWECRRLGQRRQSWVTATAQVARVWPSCGRPARLLND